MASDPQCRLLTADEFLRIDFGPDMKAELDRGVVRMMAGGTHAHSRVQMNLYGSIGATLRGSGYRPHGSDMAVRVSDRSVRYPDLTIDCGSSLDRANDLTLSDPRVVVEVLSPTTRIVDLGVKLDEYRAVASVQAVAFVDPEAETVAVTQRTAGGGWSDVAFVPGDLALPMLTVPHAEVFATD